MDSHRELAVAFANAVDAQLVITKLLEELLNVRGAAMLMFWESGYDKSGDDGSYREAIDKSGELLRAFSVPAATFEEFAANVESILRSGKHPKDWPGPERISPKQQPRV